MSLADDIRTRLTRDQRSSNPEHLLRCAATYSQALTAVLDYCDQAEHGALRWENPLPVPAWVPELREAIATAMGIPHVHTEACEHRLVPLEVEGVSVCDLCHDRYGSFRYCPDRCPVEAARCGR